MFRKPRDQNTTADVGRPPSPGSVRPKTPFTLAVPPSVPPPSKMAVAKTKSKAVPLPTIGRQGPTGSAKKGAGAAKIKAKPNGNILNFFKKDDGLFLQDGAPSTTAASQEEMDVDLDRFNEDEVPSKRRRLSAELALVDVKETVVEEQGKAEQVENVAPKKVATTAKTGPFMDDSEDDEEEEAEQQAEESETRHVEGTEQGQVEEQIAGSNTTKPAAESSNQDLPQRDIQETEIDAPIDDLAAMPPLLKQETSYVPDLADFDDFEGVEGDFDEDVYEEGDEFIERRYMEEQARIEELETEGNNATMCPICCEKLVDMSEQEVSVHVNNCLDGNPTPIKSKPAQAQVQLKTEPDIKIESDVKPEKTLDPRQFQRSHRIPRPGQQNPFMFGESSGENSISGGSAFNKLMSGKAEDAAWAEAAASEHAARGKPFYQRTCPFYKILPGFNICVDAFRYGAVQGCQAYFLSHFHSDHYVGLTSAWCHGPIYCSHVTANLVRQQLRVDPKYVVDLEFEKKVEIPGTKGVFVTMISANHCPGSSLYLYEKVIGKKSNGQPRLQRVLHCGDFRACRMHVQHPLLMPDVRDKITGNTVEQKIDVCYLDTTYLNPKYAFPSQENVIKACAEMCVSLSKVTPDETDGWEQMKRQRAGDGMVKFVRRESSGIKTEEDDNNEMKVEVAPNASQQILSSAASKNGRGRLLVIVGTYSIGKERICLGIAKALNSKIYAPPGKQRIVAALEDPELNALMTTDPRAAQVHMTPLFEIRADTLDDYLKDYYPHFTRAVGFRPSGWNYRPPNSRFTDSPSVQTVLHSDNWKSNYSMRELVPQRGSTSRASCFGVPYSEHSSFRELTMFCCALRIEKVIPTVNVGSAKGRERMKAWIERWLNERRKNGLYTLPEDGSW